MAARSAPSPGKLELLRNPSWKFVNDAQEFLQAAQIFFGARFCFLSLRRRSGERTEARGTITQLPSSPRPSPPSNGGEGVSLPATPVWGSSRRFSAVRNCSGQVCQSRRYASASSVNG